MPGSIQTRRIGEMLAISLISQRLWTMIVRLAHDFSGLTGKSVLTRNSIGQIRGRDGDAAPAIARNGLDNETRLAT